MTESMQPGTDQWDDDGRFSVLRVLLANGARGNDGFGVALYVDGKVITGYAVSRAEWLRTLVGPETPGESVPLLRRELRGVAEDEQDLPPVHATKIQHVHLINVTIHGMSKTDVIGMPQLEVALARVSGWSLHDTPRRS